MVHAARASVIAFLRASLASPGSGFDGKPPSAEQVTMDRIRALAGALLSRYQDEVSGENRMGAPANDWTLARSPRLPVR